MQHPDALQVNKRRKGGVQHMRRSFEEGNSGVVCHKAIDVTPDSLLY